MLNSLAVFCGSSKGSDPDFIQYTEGLGRFMADRDIELIYGAGNVGLMGVLADAVLAGGGKVTGVIPHFLKEWEVCHTELTELIITETMHQRKAVMAERAEGFVVLPGGFGTLDEFFEILTWRQLHLHDKPIGVLNWKGYYDHLKGHVQEMVARGFLRPENTGLYDMAKDHESLLRQFTEREGPFLGKWT